MAWAMTIARAPRFRSVPSHQQEPTANSQGSVNMTFFRRQRVRSITFVGPKFENDWSEKATIIGRHDRLDGHWYVILFDNGDTISSHAERLMTDNEPPFKGRLPTYASTQR